MQGLPPEWMALAAPGGPKVVAPSERQEWLGRQACLLWVGLLEGWKKPLWNEKLVLLAHCSQVYSQLYRGMLEEEVQNLASMASAS